MGLHKVPHGAGTAHLGARATNDHINTLSKGVCLADHKMDGTMYHSSDWVVRLDVTSWTHKCHVGSKHSWSTINLPVQRRPKWAMVRVAHKTFCTGNWCRGQASTSRSYMKASLWDSGLDWICMVQRHLCSWSAPLSGSERPMSMCSASHPI